MSNLINVRNTDATIIVGGPDGASVIVDYGSDWDTLEAQGITGYRITPSAAGVTSSGTILFDATLAQNLDWDNIVSNDFYAGPQFSDSTTLARISRAFTGPGDDTLEGTVNPTELVGGDGDDLITGGNGNDTLRGDSRNSFFANAPGNRSG